MRIFSYVRVSPFDSTLENRKKDLLDKIQGLQPQRIFFDHVKISVPALERPEFKMLIENRMEPGDKLVLEKIDGLGNTTTNILQTIHYLTKRGIVIQSLDIPYDDVNEKNMDYILPVFRAIFEFDKDKIIEESMSESGGCFDLSLFQKSVGSYEQNSIDNAAASLQVKSSNLSTAEITTDKVIISPLFGEFYLAENEDGSPAIKIDSEITVGQKIGVVDVKGLKNTVLADRSGVVVDIMVQSGDKVEIEQPLIAIK